MDVRATDISQPVDELVLVDAQTGGIRLHFNQLDTPGVKRGHPMTLSLPILLRMGRQMSLLLLPPMSPLPPKLSFQPYTQRYSHGNPHSDEYPSSNGDTKPTQTSVPTETLEPTDTLLPSQTPGQPTAQPTGVSPMVVTTWYVAPDGIDNPNCNSPDQPCEFINQ